MKKKYRLFGKISYADILIAALLVGVFSFAIYFSAPVSAEPGDTKIRYTIELTAKATGFDENIKTGVKLYDNQRGFEIGEIVDVYARAFLARSSDYERNVITRTEVEGFQNVYVVVEAAANITDRATSIGQFDVMVGKQVFVRSKDFASPGYIVVIERVE